MTGKIATTNIKMTPEMKEELIKKAGRRQLSLSAFCRMILADILKKEG